MPLPKIDVPTYELKIPSSGKEITIRPFLVKEEKLLFIAAASKDLEIHGILFNIIISNRRRVTYSALRRPNPGSRTQDVFGERILILGATGSSNKTTLINAMVNYMMGVEWDDDFRFKLIDEPADKSQAQSQTDLVTTYDLYEMKGCFASGSKSS